MTDDIKARLQDGAANCLKSYEAWSGNKKDSAAKQALQDAVHELRKVGARLEIEMAASDRDESSKKKIPIPAHRDAKKARGDEDGDDESGDDTYNNDNAGKSSGSGKPRRPRGPKKASPEG